MHKILQLQTKEEMETASELATMGSCGGRLAAFFPTSSRRNFSSTRQNHLYLHTFDCCTEVQLWRQRLLYYIVSIRVQPCYS
jgi:hypothetical protein